MRKKDHGKPENDDQLWEIVTRQVNPLKSARYAGVTEKAVHSHKPVALSTQSLHQPLRHLMQPLVHVRLVNKYVH
jgi:hypothetical protein